MKLILTEEVDNLGLSGDVVDVADGYGRNYLVPRGMAILATPGAMKQAESLLRARKVHEAATLDSATSAKETLESRTLRFEVRVDETGSLYGSVGAADVHRLLKERGHDVERKRIDLKPIKQIGSYEVPVQIHPQVTAAVPVEVVDEEGKVTLGESGQAEPVQPEQPESEIDEAAVTTSAAEAAAGSGTSVDALAEQALEAARAYEAQRRARQAQQPPSEDDEG